MKSKHPDFEPTDVGMRLPLLSAALLLGLVAVALASVFLFFRGSLEETEAVAPGSAFTAPQAPLEGIARTWNELEEARADRANEAEGILPIDTAKEQLARQGLPRWPAPKNPVPPIPSPSER